MKFVTSLSEPSEEDQGLMESNEHFVDYLDARGLSGALNSPFLGGLTQENLKKFVVNSLAMIPTDQSKEQGSSILLSFFSASRSFGYEGRIAFNGKVSVLSCEIW